MAGEVPQAAKTRGHVTRGRSLKHVSALGEMGVAAGKALRGAAAAAAAHPRLQRALSAPQVQWAAMVLAAYIATVMVGSLGTALLRLLLD